MDEATDDVSIGSVGFYTYDMSVDSETSSSENINNNLTIIPTCSTVNIARNQQPHHRYIWQDAAKDHMYAKIHCLTNTISKQTRRQLVTTFRDPRTTPGTFLPTIGMIAGEAAMLLLASEPVRRRTTAVRKLSTTDTRTSRKQARLALPPGALDTDVNMFATCSRPPHQ